MSIIGNPIMVGGGGKNISSIIITGPESTDTVTCTKDGNGYTATWDSTAQHWEIVGLPFGTFTITVTNGTKTKTETVLIDIAGVYEVQMELSIWLYKDGNEFTDTTGGWSYYAHNTSSANAVTKNDSDITLAPASKDVWTGITMNNYVDITGYSTLYIECEITKVIYSGNNNRFVSVTDSTGAGITISPSEPNNGVLSVDISSLYGLRIVKFFLYNLQMKITKIWIE